MHSGELAVCSLACAIYDSSNVPVPMLYTGTCRTVLQHMLEQVQVPRHLLHGQTLFDLY